MNGHRILVDSSLAWGGDIPDLVTWQKSLPLSQRSAPAFISILAPPLSDAYGLQADDLLIALHLGRVRPGYFIFDATRLADPWSVEHAQAYIPLADSVLSRPLSLIEAHLVLTRLAASCRQCPPDMRLGPAYFIFHLDADELASALRP